MAEPDMSKTWECRPAPGSTHARPEMFKVARESFEKFKREHEARRLRRRGRGMTVAQALAKMKQSRESWVR
jgi:hypothetical protein